MPEIVTTVGFDVTLKDGSIETVPPGKSEVSEEVASHWFTKAHLVGVPRGRMPMVKGEKGMMIEADEAGQRVTPVYIPDATQPPVRQEGPVSWSKDSPTAKKDAEALAKEMETSPQEPVDGKKEAASKSSPDKEAAIKAEASAKTAANAAITAAAASQQPAVASVGPSRPPPVPAK